MSTTPNEMENKRFDTFDDTEKAVLEFCKAHFHPVRVDSKKKVSSHNEQLKDDSRIVHLPDDAIYGCR